MFITYFLPLLCLPAVVDSPSMLCTSDCTSVRIIYQNITNGKYTHSYKPILLSNIANIKLHDWNELAGASNIANIKFRACMGLYNGHDPGTLLCPYFMLLSGRN